MDTEAAAAEQGRAPGNVVLKVELPTDGDVEMVMSSSSGSSSASDIVSSTGQLNLSSSMWKDYCKDIDDASWIAPVHFFKNAPFAERWIEEYAKLGLVVEVPNPYSIRENLNNLKCWFGEIVGFAGYRALVNFLPVNNEGDSDSEPRYMWFPFCSDIPRHIGFSSEVGIPLVPVKDGMSTLDQAKIAEIQASLQTRKTIARNHSQIVHEELASKSRRFGMGTIVEAVDKGDSSRYRLATVIYMVGDRVHVLYCDKIDTDDAGYWFSQNSPYIQNLGWCNEIGTHMGPGDLEKHWNQLPTVDPSTFPKTPPGVKIKRGMLFEMIHPILPHKIVPGYVTIPHRHGYFAALTDWTRRDELAQIVLHITSDDILPLNFCRDHGLRMDPPTDGVSHNNQFSWKRYLTTEPGVSALDLSAVQRPNNPFTKGCKLEAVNVVQPEFIRPATVTTVAGHLIRIHFDGNDRTDPKAFQWISCTSPDIYPVGYAEMVGERTRGRPVKPLLCDMIQRPILSASRRQN